MDDDQNVVRIGVKWKRYHPFVMDVEYRMKVIGILKSGTVAIIQHRDGIHKGLDKG